MQLRIDTQDVIDRGVNVTRSDGIGAWLGAKLVGGADDLALDLLRMAVADVQASIAKAKRRNLSS